MVYNVEVKLKYEKTVVTDYYEIRCFESENKEQVIEEVINFYEIEGQIPSETLIDIEITEITEVNP